MQAGIFVIALADPADGFGQGLTGGDPGGSFAPGVVAVVFDPCTSGIKRHADRAEMIGEEVIRHRRGIAVRGQPETRVRMQDQRFVRVPELDQGITILIEKRIWVQSRRGRFHLAKERRASFML